MVKPLPAAKLILTLLGLAAVATALTGCGMFQASGQGGGGQASRFGAGVSIPLGK